MVYLVSMFSFLVALMIFLSLVLSKGRKVSLPSGPGNEKSPGEGLLPGFLKLFRSRV